MASVKGCNNHSCIANKNKLKYKKSDEFCSKCGKELIYVCPKCYTPLTNESEKYCLRHLAEMDDKKERRNKALAVVGTGILGVCTIVITKGKDVTKFIAKIK